jgi:glycosyltransferase involved in cell wall biosynthesis
MAKKKSLRVTIGIPTYNRANSYLKNALASALAQQYENLEIVVSDNCSTDHTKSLIKSMDDGRIRYFYQPKNIPANDNFNYCLQQATGDYFLLLHDDDLIDADFVTTCMQAADGNADFGTIFTGVRTIDGSGKVLKENENKISGYSTDDFFLGWFDSQIALYLCSTLYNTKALKALGGYHSPKDLFQDVVATVQLVAKHGHLDIRDIKASFRRHGDNRGKGANVLDWSIDSRYLLDLMCQLSAEKRTQIRKRGLEYFCRLNYFRASTIANPMSRWNVYHQIYKQFERSCSLYYAFRKYEVSTLKALVKR